MELGPSERYYASLVGAWSGTFTFAVTDEASLAAQPFGTRALVRASAKVSPMRFSTTLEGEGRLFVHTTRVVAMGVTAYTTEERIVLAGDGASLRMEGVQRMSLGRTVTYVAEGRVAGDASGATYEIPWLGITLVQRTRIEEGKLRLTQETPFSRAEVLLARASA